MIEAQKKFFSPMLSLVNNQPQSESLSFFVGGSRGRQSTIRMIILEIRKACFKRSRAKEEKEKRSPYANEEVAKIPKEEMMERIADVVKAESEKSKQEKGRDEGYKVGWVGSRSTKRKALLAQRYWFESNS